MTLSLRIKLVLPFFLIMAAGIASPVMAESGLVNADKDLLHETSVKIMKEALEQEKEWVKVHAAESLLLNNYTEGVRDVFLNELNKQPSSTYKIDIWRVLVQAAGNSTIT